MRRASAIHPRAGGPPLRAAQRAIRKALTGDVLQRTAALWNAPLRSLSTRDRVTADTVDRASSPVRLSPLVWLNLVCLDAPIVAVTWQWLFARSFHISLSATPRVALFLTAWFIYLADRFVDTLSLGDGGPKSLRQQFCQRHRCEWIVLLLGTSLFDTWLVMRHLDGRTVVVGLLIGVASICYLATNYWLGRIWRIIPAKEICIGFLFAIGTVVALIPKIESDLAFFIVSCFLFAALCFFNCASIAVWECELDQTHDKNSIATRWPKVGRYLRRSVIVLAGLCAVIAIIAGAPATLCVFIGLSALLLGTLDLMQNVIGRDERTALADLVLLTPLILLVFGFVA